MNTPLSTEDWEDRLRAGLGVAPTPNFAAWCEQHTADLKPAALPVQLRAIQNQLNWRTLMKSLQWIAAALLIVSGLLWMNSGGEALLPSAVADVIPGVDHVETLTWTTTYYVRYSSQDGQKSWVRAERRLHAYRHPGQYRETMLDEQGQPYSVQITDYRAGRMLTLDLKGKQAVLKSPVNQHDERGPFSWVGDIIRERTFGEGNRVKSVSLEGLQELDANEANIVRAMIQYGDNQPEQRIDFLFGTQSKQLVGIWAPNEVDLEFETMIDPAQQAESTWYKMTPIAALEHEFVLTPNLELSQFSLDPPADYAFEKIAPPTVTEEELIAYLDAAARFNDNQFPDSPYIAFDSDKFNAASEKAASERTAAEQALIDIRDKLLLREIYRSPVKQFEEDQTVPNSFHYVGSGVKVGEADRIVGWYKLRNSSNYRALYGDLSVKPVTESELPLSIVE